MFLISVVRVSQSLEAITLAVIIKLKVSEMSKLDKSANGYYYSFVKAYFDLLVEEIIKTR